MAVFDLFSKRQKRLRGEIPEVYTYNAIPHELRVQIIYIIRDAIGTDKYETGSYEDKAKVAYNFIHNSLCREYGRLSLGTGYQSDKDCVLNFLLKTPNVEEVIDVTELSFKYIDRIIRENFLYYGEIVDVNVSPDDAIEELNQRFKEHGIGYQFDGGEIMRVDSTYAHSEIVKPAINLLWDKKFEGANEEYLKAHEHYRHGRNKECLNECLKAFESVLKTICEEKKWQYNKTDTSQKLVDVCLQNGLVPSFTQNQFSSLRNLLVSGINTIRNKVAGHGQGQTPQSVDDELTRYALNLTGTNIIFLVEQSGLK